MLEFFRAPLFKRDYYLEVKEHRKRVDQQLAAVLGKKFARVQDYSSNPLQYERKTKFVNGNSGMFG
jgi:hypothetical protein